VNNIETLILPMVVHALGHTRILPLDAPGGTAMRAFLNLVLLG
jgi:hypothetical protein